MNVNELLNHVGGDWNKVRTTAAEQLLQTQELLAKLQAKRGDAPPSPQERELESLANQLTAVCQQIEAQFSIVNQNLSSHQNTQQEVQNKNLFIKLERWNDFLKLGLIDKIDFYHQWIQALGIPGANRDPKTLHEFGAYPKNIAACTAWEKALLAPRKISSMMEIGSKFGLNAFYLSRMTRMGAVERKQHYIKLSKNLATAGFFYQGQPPIGFTEGNFQPHSAATVPTDYFDAIWFHRQPWNEWISQDGPALTAAIGELARRFHFLLLTTDGELPPRHDLLTPLYELHLAGEHHGKDGSFQFFVAQRRFTSIGGIFFPCSDIRIHDYNWQGFESLAYGARLLPWNTSSFHLQNRRLLLGKGQVVRTFLKRTVNPTASLIQDKESHLWGMLRGLIPEIPTILGTTEDTVGYHLLLNLNTPSARFPSFPIERKDRYLILRSALRVLQALRQKGLHLNFLRLANFALAENHAILLSAEFISLEEREDPLDAFLWLLRDLTADKIYWHAWPIELFRVETVNSLPEEYHHLALIALRSKHIDEFLKHPTIEKIILNDAPTF